MMTEPNYELDDNGLAEFRGWVKVSIVQGPFLDVAPAHLWTSDDETSTWGGRLEPFTGAGIASWNAPVVLTFADGETAGALLSPTGSISPSDPDRTVSAVFGRGAIPAALSAQS